MGITKTVLVSAVFMDEMHKCMINSANVIERLQLELNSLHSLSKKLYSKNCKLKLVARRLYRSKRSRMKPKSALQLFQRMLRVLKFQRNQVKSLAKTSYEKEQFAAKLWSAKVNQFNTTS